MAYGDGSGPLALAHRGGAQLAPENTLAAFERSMALGVRYLESDIRLTADGSLVCFHDETLDRVTDGTGPVTARPLAEVKAGARMLLSLDVLAPDALALLRAELAPGPEGQGAVEVRLRTGTPREPRLRLGRSFQLDGELAERLASLDGVANVQLTTQRGPNLRLVA